MLTRNGAVLPGDHPQALFGFTLIEVLIAMAIFSIGFLSIAGVMTKAFSGNVSAKRGLLGVTIATDVLERLSAEKYATHPDLVDTQDGWRSPSPTEDGIDNDFDGQIDEPGEKNQLAKVRWKVHDNVPQPNCKTITVEVRWQNGKKECRYSVSEVRSALF